MLKKSLYILIVSIVMLSITSTSVFSNSGVANVVLFSQSPDPVQPGNYVDLSFRISNPGTSTISNAQIELVENRYISRAPNEPRIIELGAIPAFTTSDTGFTIAKIRVFVDETTPIGDQEIELKIGEGSQEFTRSFIVSIREDRPSLIVEVVGEIDDLTYSPGEQKTLTLQLENTNSIDLRDVRVSVQTSQREESPTTSGFTTDSDFYILQSSNVKRIETIEARNSQEISFNLGISPTATIKPYQIPLTIEYSDVLGNSYTEEVSISVLVNAQTNLLLSLDRVESSRVTFGLANPGPGVVRGAFVEIFDDEGNEISSEYIGDLNADDFQTIQIDYSAQNTTQDIELVVKYSDGYYQSLDTSKSFTIEAQNSGNGASSSSVIYIIIVVALIAGFFWYRKRKSSKDEE